MAERAVDPVTATERTAVRRTRAALAAALLAAVAPLAVAEADDVVTYGPPFALGPAGGDSFSRYSAEPGGTVTIGRVYPVPALIGCGSGAPFANLRVEHVATAPVSQVVVHYDAAAVEPYTFLSVGVHAVDEWFASAKQRGLLAGAGSITVPVDWPAEDDDFPRTVLVDVGLEASGACPSVSGGRVTFTSVDVS